MNDAHDVDALASGALTPGAPATDALAPNALSVSQLVQQITGVMQECFGSQIWVIGEIRDFRQPSKMTYFNLIEPAELGKAPKATLPVVLFPRDKERVEESLSHGFAPAAPTDATDLDPADSTPLADQLISLKEGTRVCISGRLTIYEPWGKLQLIMSDIDPTYTLGQLAFDRQKLLSKLAEEGLLELNAQQFLSAVPLRICLVTSYDSAAYHDVVDQLQSSGIGWELTPINCNVQGARAEDSIVSALESAEPGRFDAVMLVRGGGSATDLAAFDSERVARTIAKCQLPVFTGIGHETDRSVADEVAFAAHKTPTACAQALIDLVKAFASQTAELWDGIQDTVLWQLQRRKEELASVGRAVQVAPAAALALSRQFLDVDAPQSLNRTGRNATFETGRELDAATVDLGKLAGACLENQRRDLSVLEAQLKVLDPANILARGWSITRNVEGKLLRSVADVAPGDAMRTQFVDGEVISTAGEPVA